MKYAALLLLPILFSACETSEEDRNFYYNGWMHPERDANRRIYGGDINHPKPAPTDEPAPAQ